MQEVNYRLPGPGSSHRCLFGRVKEFIGNKENWQDLFPYLQITHSLAAQNPQPAEAIPLNNEK
jgi:hypothetical protein